MRSGIEYRQISPEQYIIPPRRAVAHRTNRRLVFDYQQYLRQPFSLVCSDLKSCYGRISHTASILVFQRIWIPLPSVIRMLDTIQCMSHKIRKAYRDSNTTYSGDTILNKFKHFIMVIFQGNGYAPQLVNYKLYSFLSTANSRLQHLFCKILHNRNSTAVKIQLHRRI